MKQHHARHQFAHQGAIVEDVDRSSIISNNSKAIPTNAQTRLRPQVLSLLVTSMLLWATCVTSIFGQTPADLVGGLASRSTAIASGRIEYSFKSESFVGDRALSPIVFPDVTTSFFSSSWAERAAGNHKVRINHDGYFLEFVQTPQRDGSVRPGATLYPPRFLDSRKELNAPPIFAGSFWHREQLRFVEDNADKCRIAGLSVVDNIPVTVLELAVAAENHRNAFHVLLPNLKAGGIIRLYVAPQLGFVLPRVEFLTTARLVAQSYGAIDYTEVAPGVYFPGRLWTETHAAGGASRYRGEFSVRCALINQPIPEEDFVVDMPVGTRIQDARQPGSVTTFELAKASTSEKSTVFDLTANSPVRFLDRWRNAVIVGAVIGTISSIGFYFATRNQRSCV